MPVSVYTPKGYCAKEDVENFTLLAIDLSTITAQQLDTWIAWAEKFIDDQTGKNFKVTADETVVLDGPGGDALDLGRRSPIISLASVEIQDGTGNWKTQTRSEYLPPASGAGYDDLKERGSLIWDPNSPNKASDPGTFTRGRQNVRLVGRFGYATPPADINFAATFLVAQVINYAHHSPSEIKSESLGAYSVSYQDMENLALSNEDVMRVIRKYRGARIF